MIGSPAAWVRPLEILAGELVPHIGEDAAGGVDDQTSLRLARRCSFGWARFVGLRATYARPSNSLVEPMPGTGFEPVWPFGQRILSPAGRAEATHN
jgi:hypothetical protein